MGEAIYFLISTLTKRFLTNFSRANRSCFFFASIFLFDLFGFEGPTTNLCRLNMLSQYNNSASSLIRTRLIEADYTQFVPNLVRLLTTVKLNSLRTVRFQMSIVWNSRWMSAFIKITAQMTADFPALERFFDFLGLSLWRTINYALSWMNQNSCQFYRLSSENTTIY